MSFASFRLPLASIFFSWLLISQSWAQTGGSADAYTAATTNMEMRLSAIEDQMRIQTGRFEQLDYALRRLDQALQRLQSDYDVRLAKLESAPAPTLAPKPQETASPMKEEEQTEESDEVVAGTLGSMKMRGGKVTGAVSNPKTPSLPDKPDDYGLTPQEQYDRAFMLLRQADYDKAEKAFGSFIEKNPKDKLTENAQYWHAETFYVRKQYGDAAIAFAKAYERNPQGSKAPDSLLKLAMSLAAVDKTEDACHTLEALKTKYPKAPTTIRARVEQERVRLKCK